MSKITDFIDGKKTYIGGAIIFIAGGLLAIKVIDDEMFKIIAAIGTAITTFGIRHAIKKIK